MTLGALLQEIRGTATERQEASNSMRQKRIALFCTKMQGRDLSWTEDERGHSWKETGPAHTSEHRPWKRGVQGRRSRDFKVRTRGVPLVAQQVKNRLVSMTMWV